MAREGARAWRELFAGLMMALGVWLAGQALRPALGSVLPPQIALRVDPGSPDTLARVAEARLAAGDRAGAARLAQSSIARSPFDVRALRVLGLATESANPAQAARLIALAGDWSLRDNQAQAWLLRQSLARGDLAEAVYLSDLLARQHEELHPQIFAFFDAVAQDAAGAALVANRLRAPSLWRASYLSTLGAPANAEGAGANIALAAQRSGRPLTNAELAPVYGRLAAMGRDDELRSLRAGLDRPAMDVLLSDGDFPRRSTAPEPFGWTYATGAGWDAAVGDAPGAREGTALRLGFDGFTPGVAASQLFFAAPGAYRLAGQVYWETPPTPQPPAWIVICRGSGRVLASPAAAGSQSAWTRFSADFTVPTEGCPALEVRLATPAGERRTDAVVWFDDLALTRR